MHRNAHLTMATLPNKTKLHYSIDRTLNLTTFPRKHVHKNGQEPRSSNPCHLHSQII